MHTNIFKLKAATFDVQFGIFVNKSTVCMLLKQMKNKPINTRSNVNQMISTQQSLNGLEKYSRISERSDNSIDGRQTRKHTTTDVFQFLTFVLEGMLMFYVVYGARRSPFSMHTVHNY